VTYIDQAILEAHSFRQTQTALTSYWMMRDGFRLAYETPVVGYPWSIPYEFPIYQWVVAVIAQAAGTSLTDTGRSVSFLFLLASLIPAAMIVRRLGLPWRVWFAFSALFLSSPLYLFWGRTFMIETTATCLMLFALAYGLDVVRRSASWTTVALAFVWSTLALLQKVTTALPIIALLMAAWLIVGLARAEPRQSFAWREWLKVSMAWGLSLVIGAGWSTYSDRIRVHNAVAVFSSSSYPLNVLLWNFGSPDQRVSTALWMDVVVFRGLFLNAGAGLGAVLIGAALGWRTRNRTRWIVAGALAAYSAALLVFTNLHIVHDYYQVACTVFLIAAVAVAIGEWLPSAVPSRFAWVAVLLAVVSINLYQFSRYDLSLMQKVLSAKTNRTLAIASEIDRLVPVGTPILVYGFEWSSEVAYYAQRKSFTVPEFFPRILETLTEPEKFLGGVKPGAVVACPGGKASPELVDLTLASRDQYTRIDLHDCRILVRRQP